MGVIGSQQKKVTEYLVENGRLQWVPVASKKADRKFQDVGFWLNGDLQYMPVSKAQFSTLAVGDSMQVVHGLGTDYLMWPEDVNNRELRKSRQQAVVGYLLAGVCGSLLLWRLKPKNPA